VSAGAQDNVIKEHIKRLGAAVAGALDRQRTRLERKKVEDSFRRSERRLNLAQRLGRIATTCSAVKDAQGRVVRLLGTVQDITKRKRADARIQHFVELQEQRDRFAQIVASSQEAMALVNGEFVYLETNAAYARLVNTPAERLIGRAIASVIGEDVFEQTLRTRLEQCLAGQEVRYEAERSRADGSPGYFESVYSPCHSPDGSVFGVAACIRDVTERRQAEQALQVERDNLSAFLAATPAAVLALDGEQRVVLANLAAEKLIGRPLAAMVGKQCGGLLGCVHKSGTPRGCGTSAYCVTCSLHAIVSEALEHRRTTNVREIAFEISSNHAKELRWIIANSAPLTLDVGPGAVLAFYDVTERRRAEDMVRFQAMLLESQNEASIDGILVADQQGRALWSNRRFAELLGLPKDAIRQDLTVMPLLVPSDKFNGVDEHRAHVTQLMLDNVTKSRDEIQLKDGRTLDRYSAPVTDNTGAHLGRVWLFRDVTHERNLQASIAQSDRLASMGMLAAGVAHEINNPLSYILYNLESLIEELKDWQAHSTDLREELARHFGEERLREFPPGCLAFLEDPGLGDIQDRLQDALGGTRRIKDIARGLGTFSRVEKERVLPTDMCCAIESAISIAFNEIKYRARLEKDFSSRSRVMASDGRLSQVFLNLFVNAAHAIQDGDADNNRIRVKTWEFAGEAFVEVSDTGCGILPENLPRIFDPFFTTKPVGVGSGLGLHIARDIVTSYRGSIEVSTEVGKGTSFVIRFPLAAEGPSRPSTDVDMSRSADNVCGRILVVDDESAVRSALSRVLKSHEIVEAESGWQACEIIAQDQRFDVILCDTMMPRGSGIDVHKWLIAHHPQLARRLVFVTGGAFSPNARAYLNQAGSVNIDKPFDWRHLQKLVAEWVRTAGERR
jgi:PAS domain S-box-containing protein